MLPVDPTQLAAQQIIMVWANFFAGNAIVLHKHF